MALPRPTFIDLGDSRANSSLSIRWTAEDDSPRVQHFDGDVPPALSPLDAFAAHSRRLARELEETRKQGERRMSRLPPQHITKSLNEHKESRPAVFRQLSGEADQVPPLPQLARQDSGVSPEVTEPKNRPKSSYPRFSAVVDGNNSENAPMATTPKDLLSRQNDYFGVGHAESPTALQGQTTVEVSSRKPQTGSEIPPSPVTPSNADPTFTLAPPRASFARKPYHESSEDEYTSSNAGSTFSQVRKLSSSSGVSGPHSPASPFVQSFERSPSVSSEYSLSTPGNRKSRSHMNFSRLMSSSSLNNLVQHSPLSPTRQESNASQGSRTSNTLPGLPTPSNSFDESRSIRSDGFVGEPQSYTHATYTLPRGRKSDRASVLFAGLNGPDFAWQEPMFPGTPPLEGRTSYEMALPSPNPLSRPSNETQPVKEGFSFDFLRDQPRNSAAEKRPSSSKETTSASLAAPPPLARPSTSASPSTSPFIPPLMPPIAADRTSSSESRSNSTIRPTTARTHSDYQALSADEHVTKAIDLHEHGDLKESTYHLRIAAKQNHPTGMLLYALACRHGWGMRQNPKEGVQWLRKAVDMAQLEVAEDENPSADKPQPDLVEKKAHRAQFALSIYELGQCHLNGWGMDVDKALALRCFEIAGTWGDTDALTEAGFCYAEGIGCKKDLRKAAKWYREAEKRGVNMVGNSWIHKEKYDENVDDRKTRSRKMSTANDSKRSKSKTRSIFLRKKA